MNAPDTARLRSMLDRIIGETPGLPRRVVELRRSPAPYYSSFPLEVLDVRLDDGTELSLVLKNLSRDALLPDARRARPWPEYRPWCEIDAYRHVLHPLGISAPSFFGAVAVPEAHEYFLFVENVTGVPLWQIGDLAAWQGVARWLGALHERLLPRAKELIQPTRLGTHDAGYYEHCRATSIRTLAVSKDLSDAAPLLRLLDRYQPVVDRLASLPRTFVHGEFYPSNIVVADSPEGTRVCPVDWEMAALAPGLEDLADLTAGSWPEAHRRSMEDAYRAAAPTYGSVPDRSFAEALDCCRLHRAIQWTARSEAWTPPAEHRHDWAGEALRLGRKLELI